MHCQLQTESAPSPLLLPEESSGRVLPIPLHYLAEGEKSLVQTALRPLHYLGSKFPSPLEVLIRIINYIKNVIFCRRQGSIKEIFQTGYQMVAEPLPVDKIDEALKFARLYAATHTSDSDWLPKGCQIVHEYTDHTLKVCLIKEGNTMHVVFGAAGAVGKSARKPNVCQGLLNIAGVQPHIYDRAERVYLQLVKQGLMSAKHVVFSGQSLGGSLAQYVALRQEKQAVCLNSLGIGAEAQWKIGRPRLSKAKDLITHISVRKDPFSAPVRSIRILDTLINFLGIRTVGNFGKSYNVAKPRQFGMDKTHRLILSSLIKHRDPNAPLFQGRAIKREAKQYLKQMDSRC